MSRAEINQIKERSKLVPEIVEAVEKDGMLCLRGNMDVNDVHCYLIQKDS